MHHSDRDVHRQGFECAPPIRRRTVPQPPAKVPLPLGKVLAVAAVLLAVLSALNP